MATERSADLFGFERLEGRAVVAGFDGGKMTIDAVPRSHPLAVWIELEIGLLDGQQGHIVTASGLR
jgi:hypothetical protein